MWAVFLFLFLLFLFTHWSASPAMVVSLPPVHLIAAGLDPLLDDSVEFALRLKRLGVPFHLKVFEKVRTGMYCVRVC